MELGPRGRGTMSRAITISLSPQCGGSNRALRNEKLLFQLIISCRWGTVVTNDGCINTVHLVTDRSISRQAQINLEILCTHSEVFKSFQRVSWSVWQPCIDLIIPLATDYYYHEGQTTDLMSTWDTFNLYKDDPTSLDIFDQASNVDPPQTIKGPLLGILLTEII